MEPFQHFSIIIPTNVKSFVDKISNNTLLSQQLMVRRREWMQGHSGELRLCHDCFSARIEAVNLCLVALLFVCVLLNNLFSCFNYNLIL